MTASIASPIGGGISRQLGSGTHWPFVEEPGVVVRQKYCGPHGVPVVLGGMGGCQIKHPLASKIQTW